MPTETERSLATTGHAAFRPPHQTRRELLDRNVPERLLWDAPEAPI